MATFPTFSSLLLAPLLEAYSSRDTRNSLLRHSGINEYHHDAFTQSLQACVTPILALDDYRQSDNSLETAAELLENVSSVYRTVAECGLPSREVVRLSNTLLANYVQIFSPLSFTALRLVGAVNGDDGVTFFDNSGTAPHLDLSELIRLLHSPLVSLRRHYQLDADATITIETLRRKFLPRLNALCFWLGIRSSYNATQGTLSLHLGGGLPSASIDFTPTIRAGQVTCSVSASSELPSLQTPLRVGPLSIDPLRIEIAPAGSRFLDRLLIETRVSYPASSSGILIGSSTGMHARADKISLYALAGQGELKFELAAERCGVVLSAASSDSFTRTAAGNRPVDIRFDFLLGWSRQRGIYLGATASLERTWTIRRSIGPVMLEGASLKVVARADEGDGELGLHLGAVLVAQLGPLTLTLAGMGFQIALGLGEGNLGCADLRLGLVSPSGVAIRVSASGVTGSGFLRSDAERHEYSGQLQLAIGKVALSAVGLVQTQVPELPGRYSFLIAISAAFPDIQLGMGFTLRGVGGLCGIQRSVSLDALQSGVRDGSLVPLLFPRDPMGQASQLIAGLQRVFPPTQDRYVFGPMFKLGWGTPTLVTADLGVILQLPAPIVIALIGTLRATFPKPQAAIVVLNIDITGSVEPAEKRLAIDARIRDSRIAGYTLTGDMALRLRWGERPDFALALGGFHRAYQPPEGFPELRRLSLGLSRGNTFRMTCAAYLALTSNSLQLGARAEIFVQTLGFNVLGYLEFNALVMFSPFSFRFDFAAGLSLRRGTRVLAGITVAGLVSGPQPWRVQGSASISILFFELSVSFDVEFGQPQVTAPPEPMRLWERLRDKVLDLRNWTAVLPPETHRVVSLSSAGGAEAPLRLDPMGGLRFTQTEVPLERRITRFGEMSIDGPTTFHVQSVRLQGLETQSTPVQESFAPGQYQHLTEAEKLSRPSFEPMDAGMSLCADAMQVRGVVERPIVYNTIEITGDDEAPQPQEGPYTPSAAVVAASLDFAGAQLAPLHTTGDDRFLVPGAVPLVALADEPYLVVHASSMQPLTDDERAAFPGAATTTAPGAAHDALAAFLCAHPEAQGRYRVVPRYEAAMGRG